MRIFKILATITFVLSLSAPTFYWAQQRVVQVVAQGQLDQQQQRQEQLEQQQPCLQR